MDSSQITVTVCMAVYNHEKYLRKAIESILMQQTSYAFEIFIHEDASTDGSAAIIREYQKKYSDKIRAVFQKENLYMKHRMQFRKSLFSNLTGKYVAVCEGDDYWIDPYKIQKQVDYLENHPEYVAVAQQVKIVDEDGYPYVDGVSGPKINKQHIEILENHDFSLSELQQGRMIGQLGSSMYKNIWKEMPSGFFDDLCQMDTNGDRIITTVLFFSGKIRCKKEVVSAYRRSYSNTSYNARVYGKNMCLSFIQQARDFQFIAKYFQAEVDFSEIYAKAVFTAIKYLYKNPTKENGKLLVTAWKLQPEKINTIKLLAKKIKKMIYI